MGKKFKPKASKAPYANHLDLASTMMTEQEEKMFYANKKLTAEEISHQENFNNELKDASNFEKIEN